MDTDCVRVAEEFPPLVSRDFGGILIGHPFYKDKLVVRGSKPKSFFYPGLP